MRCVLELKGGPQDGSRIVAYIGVGDSIPTVIHVGPKWLGDGYSAYTTDGPCKRFPARYEFNGNEYYNYSPGRVNAEQPSE